MADKNKKSIIRKPGAVRRPGMGNQDVFGSRTRIVDRAQAERDRERLAEQQNKNRIEIENEIDDDFDDFEGFSEAVDIDDDFEVTRIIPEDGDIVRVRNSSDEAGRKPETAENGAVETAAHPVEEDMRRYRPSGDTGSRNVPDEAEPDPEFFEGADDGYALEDGGEGEASPEEVPPETFREKRSVFGRKKKKSVLKQQKVTQEEYKFHKKMKRRRRRMVLVLLLVLLMVAVTIAAGYTLYTFVVDHFNNEVSEDSIIIDIETEQKFRVEKRESTKSISQRLYDAGLIESTQIYRLLSKFYGYDGQYNAGTYTLSKGLTYEEIMYILSGTPETVKVTFPEGFTTEQMAVRLENNHVCTAEEFLDAVDNADISSYDFLRGVDFSGRDHRLDGYLFPDTYEFDVYAKPEEVVYKMLNRFNEIFRPAYYEQLQVTGLTLDQVVILASIVEKEAKLDSDRAPIAGVFYNRYMYGGEDLKLFQSDATVRYSYRRVYGEDLTHSLSEELELDDPYNTYVYPGFPPGPICSPGEASLIGAVFPSNHDYYYFVARVDGSGGNVFSRTYEEHQQAIKDIANYVPSDDPGDEDVEDDW